MCDIPTWGFPSLSSGLSAGVRGPAGLDLDWCGTSQEQALSSSRHQATCQALSTVAAWLHPTHGCTPGSELCILGLLLVTHEKQTH
jgi:hypothetical protein